MHPLHASPSPAHTNSHRKDFSLLMSFKDGSLAFMLYIFYELSRPSMSLPFTSHTDFLFDLKGTLNTSFPKPKGSYLPDLISFQGSVSWCDGTTRNTDTSSSHPLYQTATISGRLYGPSTSQFSTLLFVPLTPP